MLCAVQGKAQTQSAGETKRVEGEIGLGIVFGADKLGFDQSRIGATFYAEGRYNLRKIPLDVGLQVAGTTFGRESNNAGRLQFRTWNLLAVSDYNFRLHKKATFFAGAGLGYAFLWESAPIVFDNSEPNWAGFTTGDKKGSFCFMPRVGIELWHHLRITGAYRFEEKANRHFSLTVGVVFGGGVRK